MTERRSREILYREFYRRAYVRGLCLHCNTTFPGCQCTESLTKSWIASYDDEELQMTIEIFNEWCLLSIEDRLKLASQYNIKFKGVAMDIESRVQSTDQNNNKVHSSSGGSSSDDSDDDDSKPKRKVVNQKELLKSYFPDFIIIFIRLYILTNPLLFKVYEEWYDAKDAVQRGVCYVVLCHRRTLDAYDRVFIKCLNDLELFDFIKKKFLISDFTFRPPSPEAFVNVLTQFADSGKNYHPFLNQLHKHYPTKEFVIELDLINRLIGNIEIDEFFFKLILHHCSESVLESQILSFEQYKPIVFFLFGTYFTTKYVETIKRIYKRFPKEFMDLIGVYINSFDSIMDGDTIIYMMSFLYDHLKLHPNLLIKPKDLTRFILKSIEKSTSWEAYSLIEYLDNTESHFHTIVQSFPHNSFWYFGLYKVFQNLSKEFVKNNCPLELFEKYLITKTNVYTCTVFLKHYDVHHPVLLNCLPNFKYTREITHDHLELNAKLLERILILPFPDVHAKLFYDLFDASRVGRDTFTIQFLKDNLLAAFKLMETHSQEIERPLQKLFDNEDLCKELFKEKSEATDYFVKNSLGEKLRLRGTCYLISFGKFQNLNLQKVRALAEHNRVNKVDLLKSMDVGFYQFGVDAQLAIYNSMGTQGFLKEIMEMYPENFEGLVPVGLVPRGVYEMAELLLHLIALRPTLVNINTVNFINRFYRPDGNLKLNLYENRYIKEVSELNVLNSFISLHPYCVKSKLFCQWYYGLNSKIKKRIVQNDATFKLGKMEEDYKTIELGIVDSTYIVPLHNPTIPVLPNIIYRQIIHLLYDDKSLHYLHKIILSQVSWLFFDLCSKILSSSCIEAIWFSTCIEVKNFERINIHSKYSLWRNYPVSLSLYDLVKIPADHLDETVRNLEGLNIKGIQFLSNQFRLPIRGETKLRGLFININNGLSLNQVIDIFKNSPQLEKVGFYAQDYWEDYEKVLETLVALKLPNLKFLGIIQVANIKHNLGYHFTPMIQRLQSEPYNIKEMPKIGAFLANYVTPQFSGIENIYLSFTASQFISELPLVLTHQSLDRGQVLRFNVMTIADIIPILKHLNTLKPTLRVLSFRIVKLIPPNQVIKLSIVQEIFDLVDQQHIKLDKFVLYHALDSVYRFPIYYDENHDLWSHIKIKSFPTNENDIIFKRIPPLQTNK
ncbi:hypothetical protein DLAC_05962 [Tieghemostelium lacteum]|uniref:Uncharacterized protein n=1 Tax=Tieghemostelium lacteum TaxID=361077 RepID=A0A151ZHA2_TIELA|nr:hypothetical protein DLAC_05962 [Tieghemostelium lacteum]|eukprot:KYQ93297.1 hypothetical protein DLAC_05962 [Tieghemostelium lacteum]